MAKNSEATRTFPTHIDLPKNTRTTNIALLNQQLADTADLYSQIKQAHWNVKGKDFIALHELFDDLAERMLAFVDEIAERATALGGTAMGTARMAATNSTLPTVTACVWRTGASKDDVDQLGRASHHPLGGAAAQLLLHAG